MLAVISSFGRAGNQWQRGIDHKFMTEECAAGPGSFLPAEMDLCLPSRVGSPSRAASGRSQRCDSSSVSPRAAPSLSGLFQLGSLAKGHLEHDQLPRSIPAAGSSCAGPARCAASGSVPGSRVPARPGCCCRLTAELLFHASLVLLACN